MYGMLLACFGLAMYLFGVLLALPRHLLLGGERLLAFNEWLVWYSGIPIVPGLCLALVDIFVVSTASGQTSRSAIGRSVAKSVTVVALTAYNDEDSIGDAVRDFAPIRPVDTVIVVSNNSRDAHLRGGGGGGRHHVQRARAGLRPLRLSLPERGRCASRTRISSCCARAT